MAGVFQGLFGGGDPPSESPVPGSNGDDAGIY